MERSLVILKPDALERGLAGRLLSRLEDVGLKLTSAALMRPTEELLKRHYPDSLAPIIGEKSRAAGTDIGDDPAAYGREVLRWNRDYMLRGPVLAFIVEGDGAIQRIRSLVGHTDPPKASPGTIRFDYGNDNISRANREKRGTENLVHASGSQEEAEFEISLWFPEAVRT
jgi:nucleoside-diphosphate kinase